MSGIRTCLIVLLSASAVVIGHYAPGTAAFRLAAAAHGGPSLKQPTGMKQAGTNPAPNLTERLFYQNGRMTGKLIYWHNQPWERTLFEYHDELARYSVQTMIYQGDRLALVRKDLFNTSPTEKQPDQRIESWYYHFDKDRANSLRQVDTYWPDTTLVRERQLFDNSGGLMATAIFEYDPDAARHPDESETIGSLKRMTLIGEEGEVVSDYRESIEIELHKLYSDLNLPDHEIHRRLRISQDGSRTLILVIDGGIDIGHPDLAYKIWRNPGERPNGMDDDGNGLVDDIFGISDNPRIGHPVQDLRLPRFGLPAFSHGTLVASIATEGREDVAIMAASEVTTINSSGLFPRIETLINSHGVRFTTMSFIFDRQLLAMGIGAERPHQIEQLIRNTPRTLHVAAAGNGAPINGRGFNVDRLRPDGDLVPVMLPQDNLLVVGALAADRLEREDYAAYELADFSNLGERSVDILAPGFRLCGARMGGGAICESGTSFAAPFLLNHGVLSVAKANPDLTIYQIKEILMKTVYIPDLDDPFPVRSGGILHPSRAVAAARWLKAHPEASAHNAVLAVRKAEVRPLKGESNDPVYLNSLQSFWSLRRIGRKPSWYARLKK